MRILGIDPGSILCGYGVIERNARRFSVIEYGVLEIGKSSKAFPLRLRDIFLRIQAVINRTLPDEVVIESVFFARNPSSLVKLAQARSAALLPAILQEIPIIEYSPREVKKSVTGRGNASKAQVQYMVKKILDIPETPEFYDVTDALAAALCHGLKQYTALPKKRSWKAYIEEHPEKVVRRG